MALGCIITPLGRMGGVIYLLRIMLIINKTMSTKITRIIVAINKHKRIELSLKDIEKLKTNTKLIYAPLKIAWTEIS